MVKKDLALAMVGFPWGLKRVPFKQHTHTHPRARARAACVAAFQHWSI